MRKVWFVWRGMGKNLEDRLLRERGQVKIFLRKHNAEKAARECDGRVVAQWQISRGSGN